MSHATILGPAPVRHNPRPPMPILDRRWPVYLLLGLVCFVLFFYGLGVGELYRTEGLRAIVGAEFLRSGNWLVPTLYGEPLLTKPPGMYLAIAVCSLPAGEVTEQSARLPSALAATLTVLVLFAYSARQLGRRGALVVALAVPCSAMWLDKATAAEIDMLQVAWVTTGIVCALRALDIHEGVDRGSGAFVWWLLALLCVAGGVLTKWTAPVFFYLTLVPLLVWRRHLWLLFDWRHLLSAFLAASLCLAWAAAVIRLVGWDTFMETVGREAIQRLSPAHHLEAMQSLPSHHQSTTPLWLEALWHPLKILLITLPWSGLALFTFRRGFGAQWDTRGRRLLQAFHCWAWPNLLFWSVIPEHAPRHSFPLFPAIAGLGAMAWLAWARQTNWTGAWWKVSPLRALVVVLALWLVVKVVYVQVVIPARNPNRAPREKGHALAATVPEGNTLYLFRLKDEGIMFYFGRPVRRLDSPDALPSTGEPVYCILEQDEWQHWRGGRPAEVLLSLRDEQQDPITLVRVLPTPATAPQPEPDAHP